MSHVTVARRTLTPYTMNSIQQWQPKFRLDRQQLSAKKMLAIVSGIITLYSLARVGVLFFEAVAVVREERSQDAELLELCARGDARSSPKMRDACLKARAERASPLVAKAIVYAVSTAFKDFSATVGSPFKFAVVVLFVISSVVLPIIPWARAIFGTSPNGASVGDDAFSSNPNHFIVMAPNAISSRRARLRRHMAKHIPLLRRKPTIEEFQDPFAFEQDYKDGPEEIHLHED